MDTWEDLYKKTKESTDSQKGKSFKEWKKEGHARTFSELYGENLRESFGGERSAWIVLSELLNEFKESPKVSKLLKELEQSDDYYYVLKEGLYAGFDRVDTVAKKANSDEAWQKHVDYFAANK